MSRKIYALLVGINEYSSPIPKLHGCVNDIVSFEKYLSMRTGEDFGVGLEVLSLMNEKATRQAVIDGFRTLLVKAKKGGRKRLFYYSGHGSQEQAPEEFWGDSSQTISTSSALYCLRFPRGRQK